MVIKNRNLFRITRILLLQLPFILRHLSRFRKSEKRLLLIRLDEIGDYVLFRNFIQELRNSKRFAGYKIDLLANVVWKDLALTYDKSCIDDFIFVQPGSLYEQPHQVYRLAKKLYKSNYAIVLQPAYSRMLISDSLAGFTAAKEIIGFASDTERIYAKYKRVTDRFYTRRLILPTPIDFEFERTRFFFETVLAQPVLLVKPYLPAANEAGDEYVLLVPGSGVVSKNWPVENYLALAQKIVASTQLKIVLAGGKNEASLATPFVQLLPPARLQNRIGETSLPGLVDLIANAKYVVCNDLSALHLAVATDTPAVCIVGGGHFNRFVPFPPAVAPRVMFVYEKMECFNCCWHCIFNVAKTEAFPCISINRLTDVWNAFGKLMLQFPQ